MKTIYIPRGETVQYERLAADRLVVRGCLRVADSLRAKTICGDGVIHAGSVQADVIRADEVESAEVVCKRLIAKRPHAGRLDQRRCQLLPLRCPCEGGQAYGGCQ